MNLLQSKKKTHVSYFEYLYPYQNESLSDMEGEIWKGVKNYEGLYLVSNKGRVKRLENYKIYTDKIGRLYKCFQPEKILPQRVKYRLNKHINKTVCTASVVRLSVDSIRISIPISRLVYQTFIGQIPPPQKKDYPI